MRNDKYQHGHGKHMILMLIGCLIPIGLIVGARYFNIGGNNLARYAPLLMLLCPLMHIFMMKGMMGKSEGSCHGDSKQDIDNNRLEGSNK